MVSLDFASWNQIAAWLRQLDRLGRSSRDASSAWLDVRAKVECLHRGLTSLREPQAARRRL